MLSSSVLTCIFLILNHALKGVIPQDVLGCGGFVKSEVEINFSLVEVKLYSKQGSLKYSTDCAPNNGYYMIPIYDKGEYILKVEPPPGWTFEPQSVDLVIDGNNDKCSKGDDINFQFTGFGVIGKVVSKGSSDGPAGVAITLKKKSGEVVKQTVTASSGAFTLEKVLPGDYTIHGSHSKWIFQQASADVTVSRQTGNAGSLIQVAGYDVTGQVFSEGEPIKGVHFVLYSETVKAQNIENCDKTAVQGLTDGPNTPQLCHVTSRQDGSFVFPSLTIGHYILVPFYKGDYITFDVEPKVIEFTVRHESLALQKPFQVAGFSVSGKVINSKGGSGVSQAQVYVNSKLQTETDSDGVYHLENMKAGTYTILVKSQHIFFDETNMKITPNTPQLPDVIAARFNLCGEIQIDKGSDQAKANRKVTLQRDVKDTTGLTSLLTDNQGRYCSHVKPGQYVVKAPTTEDEVKSGLRLTPEQLVVKVTTEPVFNIIFTQFRAKITGSVQCLVSCGSLRFALEPVGRSDGKQIIEARKEAESTVASYEFIEVLPGKYRVSLMNDDWCWKEKTKDVEVIGQDVSGVTFSQSGFSLTCSLSHSVKLNFEHAKSKRKGSFSLKKGVNKFCLNEPGTYKITTESCHKFEQEAYNYDTSHPTLLTLSAVRHLVEGSVTSAELIPDLMVNIKSSVEADKPIILGPLMSGKEPAPSKGKEKVKMPEGPFVYKFTYLARSGEKIEVTPTSKEVLYYPPTDTGVITGDQCPGEVVKFEGRLGVFISGEVSPALQGVDITITPQNDPEHPIKVITGDNGAYRVGPLHSHTDYDVTAHKDGYVLSDQDNKGSFLAHRLAEISVKVLSESEEGLGGVLLSVSGGTAYRSNNLTQSDGVMRFLNLSPGQYFLRPMMKEYKFEPVSQMINVEEGRTVELLVKGTRVAFSCYGSVTSLNREPEPGIFVEASGLNDCTQYQEETKTEQDGSYRIRGLQPNCEYEIKLKSGDYNHHIERTAPRSRKMKVTNADLINVDIIAFRRMTQLDLSGNVITEMEFLSNLKVHLCREDNPDSPIHTVTLGPTSFFYLPSLTMDHQNYLVRLDSTLSRRQYEYTLSEIPFTASVSYKHFTFKFEPKRKSIEQELNQSSFLVLPLALLLGLAAYHYKKLLPLLQQGIAEAQVMYKQRGVAPQADLAAQSVEQVEQIAQEIMITKKKPRLRKT